MRQAVLYQGEVLAALRELEGDSFDACLCDPPYGIGFMGKEWDRPGRDFFQRKAERSNTFDHVGGNHNPTSSIDRARTHLSENAKFQAWCEAWLSELVRVLKPGAFLLAFGGTRTFHRLAVAVEDAGFEIRDSILAGAWTYGSGFPKALDVSKAIDKEAGAEREVVGRRVRDRTQNRISDNPSDNGIFGGERERMSDITTPATPAAARWSGYGTALKPAWEPVVVGMKPLDGTFARNAVEHGVAGLNVDGARIAAGGDKLGGGAEKVDRGTGGWDRPWRHDGEAQEAHAARVRANVATAEALGRYPSNLLLTHHPDCRRAGTRTVASNSHHPAARGRGGLGTNGHAGQADLEERRGPEEVAAWECSPDCPVAAMDRQAGSLSSGLMRAGTVRAAQDRPGSVVYGVYGGDATIADTPGDSGTASRFFHQSGFEPGELPDLGAYYCAKASTAERGGTLHPTIKPLELVAYLAKLLLPPARPDASRRLLVPFSGAGSEIIGALRVGWEEVVGIEQEREWIADAERRIREDAPLFNTVSVVSPPLVSGEAEGEQEGASASASLDLPEVAP